METVPSDEDLLENLVNSKSMDEKLIITARHGREKRQLAYGMRRDMTPSEKQLWQHLRASKLGGLHFRRQQVIEGFIVDFFCHAAKLVVELDGAVHNEQREYDAERDQILAARGLLLLRFPNSSLEPDIQVVLDKILTIAYKRLH